MVLTAFDAIAAQGEAIVEVRMSAGGFSFKQAPLQNQLKQKAAIVDQHLQSCVAVLESSSRVAFWTSKKKHDIIKLLRSEREDIQIILNELVDFAGSRGPDADVHMLSRLMRADQASRGYAQEVREAYAAREAAEAAREAAEAAREAAEVALKQTREGAALDRRQHDARIRSLQKQVQELLTQQQGLVAQQHELAEAAAAANAAAANTDSCYAELLAGLELEMAELRSSTANLMRTKEMAYLQLRELASGYQSSAQLAEREVRRLQIELKKAENAYEALEAANKESAEALKARGNQLRTTQRRVDSIKTVADVSKDTAVGLRRQLEEALAQQARLQDASDSQVRRLTETRAARDSLAAELESLRREHSALHDAFVAAGGVEQQIAALRAAVASSRGGGGAAAAASGLSSRLVKCRATPLTASLRPGSAAVPRVSRVAMRCRTGWCLHGRPCGGAKDSTRLALIPYEHPTQLEAAIRDQRLFLCTACLKDGAF
ncbi:hypothetical protein GPECTOR_11g311 [Gonium pectorale]|uniref:Uncharacterized protein n=1 Tax=Gonium pectorale TaxID=33097 RepID=A0A150GPU0_GONPE|nr:hypothetical protein GPECTOR_11g311 [Gonium pectorale]|eukprot:KXZ51876.1 hypothetical protein GPECTOR_11g311 [Gonium pectorale]